MSPTMNRCFIALGSNVGDRLATLRRAIDELRALGEVTPPPYVYETRPVGPSRFPFLNTVVALETELDPPALLARLHEIEAAAGRKRRVRWDARTLDLDLLVVLDAEGRCVESRDAAPILPHPRMLGRDFVLAPLCDLAPEVEIGGVRVCGWLERVGVEGRTIVGRFLILDPRS